MKDFFKPEDFSTYAFENEPIPYGFCKAMTKICNEKLNALIESWPIISTRGNGTWFQSHRVKEDTHKARLAFIEEIVKEQCNHEPEVFEFSQITQGYMLDGDPNTFHADKKTKLISSNKCKHCGVELEAAWSEKK